MKYRLLINFLCLVFICQHGFANNLRGSNNDTATNPCGEDPKKIELVEPLSKTCFPILPQVIITTVFGIYAADLNRPQPKGWGRIRFVVGDRAVKTFDRKGAGAFFGLFLAETLHSTVRCLNELNSLIAW